MLEDLLSITILLCSAALLITVLAPWEEGSAYSAGQDTDVCWPEPLPAEPPLPADRGEPFPAEPVPVDSWQLLLVNRWHSLPEDYSVQLVELRNGFQVDERCYPDLQDMMDDCRAEGLSPVICSAYRTREYQERLYRAETERWLARGWRWTLWISATSIWTPPRRIPPYRNGSWSTAGNMALSSAIPITKARSPASSMSPGTTAMWDVNTRRSSIGWGSAWRSI